MSENYSDIPFSTLIGIACEGGAGRHSPEGIEWFDLKIYGFVI